MWLINTRTLQLESFEGDWTPAYAILSHRWEDEEVLFKDMQKQRGRDRKGYQKIKACCEQALSDGLSYAWVDTCCIDKRSSAELSEAVNSMFRWYQGSRVCYAFLSDISSQPLTTSLWFTRGWTLQELLAPNEVIFFNSQWQSIGSKSEHAAEIAESTGIAHKALYRFDPSGFCVAEKMKWAANRCTTRVEDQAYSLLGIFRINMPLIYGEAKNAFARLQREIMDTCNDTSIFLASAYFDANFGMLGTCPESFGLSRYRDTTEYQRMFTCTKQGITGTFHLYWYALDIYILDIYHKSLRRYPRDTGGTYTCLFVQWNSSVEQFQRVEVDQMIHIDVDDPYGRSSSTRNFDSVGKHEVKIGKLPLKSINSMTLSRVQMESYLYAWPSEGYVTPGMFSMNINACVENLTKPEPKLLCAQDIHHKGSDVRQCLLIECKHEPTSRRMIVVFGENLYGDPTAFITKVEGSKLSQNRSERYDCHVSGYFWYTDRVVDRTPLVVNDSQMSIPINKIAPDDYKVVQIHRRFKIHFIRQRGKKLWRVYVESFGTFDPCFIPEGWRLPMHGLVNVDSHDDLEQVSDDFEQSLHVTDPSDGFT